VTQLDVPDVVPEHMRQLGLSDKANVGVRGGVADVRRGCCEASLSLWTARSVLQNGWGGV
jgi:hypothetical protein